MTGNDPKLIFGTLQEPTCQLSIDRAIRKFPPRKHMLDPGQRRRLEEAFDCGGKYSALEQKYNELQSEVSELRGLVDMLKAAKKYIHATPCQHSAF